MPPTVEQQEIYVAIWAKAIDTQMHFNEMAVKSRQFGLGFVAAALGLGVVLLAKSEEFTLVVLGLKVHATVVIALAGAMALWAVRHLDLHVYHKMLRGAVAFGEDFEEHYMKQIFQLDKGMTQAISHFSRFDDAQVKASTAGGVTGKYTYLGSQQQRRSALAKIEKFYSISIKTLVSEEFIAAQGRFPPIHSPPATAPGSINSRLKRSWNFQIGRRSRIRQFC